MRTPAGVWVIAQISSATTSVSSLTTKALGTTGIVGYGPRIPASFLFRTDGSVDLSVLDRHRAASLAKNKLFKPRVIWGKYTPTFAFGPRIAGFAGPAPYLNGGEPNTALEAGMSKLARAIAAWSADKPDVREYDTGHASLNYSELWNGPEVQKLYGASVTVARERFIDAHKRFIDLNYEPCYDVGLPTGIGVSGHGPIGEISAALGAYAATKELGSIFVQANGFAQEGEWGGPLESTHDANIWRKLAGQVCCGLQDISAPSPRSAADVRMMFDNARKLQASGTLIVYIEQYYYQWDSGTGNFNADPAAYAEFIKQIGLFVPSGYVATTDELSKLEAELADLQAQERALVSEVSADLAALGSAEAAYDRASAEANDSAARLADVSERVVSVQDQIDALT